MLLEFLRFSDHPAPVPGGLFIPDLRFPISLFSSGFIRVVRMNVPVNTVRSS